MTNEELFNNDPQIEKTEEKTDKKCPACGGVMDFDPKNGNLHCPYCDTVVEIKKAEAVEERAFEDAEFTENCDWGVEKKVIICKSCGGETVYDALDLAGECPFCGSNQVIEESQDKKTMSPGGVVPFAVDKKSAGERFTKWIKGKLFCPKKAKEKAKAEAFRGVYLPYWTFDSDTYTTYTAKYGIDHTYEDDEGNTHTRTDWYRTSGDYSAFVNDWLVCATERHDKTLLSRIEPFNTEANAKYNPEYLAGFVSEKYSIGVKSAWESAKPGITSAIKLDIERKIKNEHSADRVSNLSMSLNFSEIKYKYLLLPIWLSSFRYKDKVYQFMVNGQTGKVGGRAPVSPLRVAIAVFIGLVIFGGLCWLFMNS